jgi:hypothetical protein
VTSGDSPPWQILRSWVGDRAVHPLRELVNAADGDSTPAAIACAAWDELLSQVEAAAPNRWQGKRKEFRGQSTFNETLSEHSELVLAAWLARAGIEFEFGQPGQPQPDLVLPEWGLGIEVGSRTLNDAQLLEDEIRAVVELSPAPEHVQVAYDTRPLAIRATARAKIVDKVRRGMEVNEEAVPAHGNHPPIGVRITRTPASGASTVTTSVDSTLLTPHLLEAEAEIRSTVIKNPGKIRQAESMPTVLVIDIARCGFAWLRPLPMWQQALERLLDEDDPYIASAVMVTGPGSDTQLAWAANPHRDQTVAERVSQLFARLSDTG